MSGGWSDRVGPRRRGSPCPPGSPRSPFIALALAISVTAPPSRAAEPSRAAAPSRATAPPSRAVEPAARPAPWLRRHLPTPHRLEPGVFVGVFAPHGEHELYDRGKTWAPYAKVAATLGLRLAYYPLRFLGAELEGAVTPTSAVGPTSAGGTSRALLYAGRGHLIAQLPLASVVPFVVLGGGVLGARSDLLGGDVDLVSHFGGGLKFYVHRYVGVRLDVRGTVGSRQGPVGARIVHPEATLGVIVPLGLQARDSDGDHLYDPGQRARPTDACPQEPGPARTRGCPDRDADAIADRDDRCPAQAGLPARNGCPALRDGDGDGVYDPDQVDIPPPGGDRCPDVAGRVEQIGCPAIDSDGDGALDPDDRCPDAAEVTNGYQDDDGCPDAVPVDVAALVGTLRGIQFGFMSAAIAPGSQSALDHAVAVMRDNPTIRLEIQGHTDAEGDPALNLALSQRRAEAVRGYMISAGIDGERLRAVGHGGDRPIADNDLEAGRAQNRRIELHLLDTSDRVVEP
jgi:OOP family OmpA-OmpF porin